MEKSSISRSFLIHAIIAGVMIAALNWLIANYVPFSIRKIEQSYLIFYYHFPSAIGCSIFFTMVLIGSIGYLINLRPKWDRFANCSAQVGLVACTATLATGSTWASAAWNTWWDWGDARLMTAAVMWLTYAGYVLLQAQIENPSKRRHLAAVFGILAWINIPMTKYAVEWFGKTSHPEQFEDFSSADEITLTRWFGVLAFLVFYLLLFRWRLAQEETRERLESVLSRVRQIEEGVN